MFQRILVPLDGSTLAEQAFPVAVRIARATGASLTLLRVVEPPTRLDEYDVALPVYISEQLDAENAEAKAYLTRVLTRRTLEGIDTTTEVRTGIIAQQILQCAQEHQNDLIVICSHGTTGFRRWLLGSVAQRVAHTSTVPVFIVREGHALQMEPQSATQKPYQTLVPLDGSALSEAVLLPAAQVSAALAAPQSGSLHLIHVVETLAVTGDMSGVPAELYLNAIQQAEAYLKKVEQQLHEGPFAAFHLTVTAEVVRGFDVATLLLKVAKDKHEQGEETHGSQMIAMSTHGRHGITDWLMGSTVERILGAATLPILIVRPEPEKTQQEHRSEIQHATPLH